MRFHSNTSTAEFIEHLRDAAIQQKQPPIVIDLIDSLGRVEDVEAQLEQTGEELREMEQSRDDSDDALEQLLGALSDVVSDLDELGVKALTMADEFGNAMMNARNALSRNGK